MIESPKISLVSIHDSGKNIKVLFNIDRFYFKVYMVDFRDCCGVNLLTVTLFTLQPAARRPVTMSVYP